MLEHPAQSGNPRLGHLAFVPLDDAVKGNVIARRLTERIALGLLADGTQLPSEADLAAQFSVSTVTLREALAELRSLGLVETRRGRGGGSFVKAPGDNATGLLTRELSELSIDGLRDLRDVKCVVSGGAAALAAARARGIALPRLRALALKVQDQTTSAGLVRADCRFHIEVAAAARSERLTQAEMLLQLEAAPLLWLAKSPALTPERAASEHLAISDAIASGDPELARSTAEAHVLSAMNHVIELRMSMEGDPNVRV
ncbi:MAG: GntR family transcriptional regulator [Actinobacteria bacterium]|nr:GntR family transcriptional regulator [Actinomycetota bacterium]